MIHGISIFTIFCMAFTIIVDHYDDKKKKEKEKEKDSDEKE